MTLALACAAGACDAALLRTCDAAPALGAAEQDRLLRVTAVVRAELQRADAGAVLVARSGLDLRPYELRGSHAGVSLRDNAASPWAVRQLYYACDEQRPRVFDEGLAGFVLGSGAAEPGYLSLLLLPPAAASALERAALDDRLALQLLGRRYSANAHAFSTQYQNCNQWLAELLAAAWMQPPADLRSAAPDDARNLAQAWLRARGYTPTVFRAGPLVLLASLLPWLHADDQPEADRAAGVFRVSMPAAIEAFVHTLQPAAERIVICHDQQRVVVRRGWGDDAHGGAGCMPRAGDSVTLLR